MSGDDVTLALPLGDQNTWTYPISHGDKSYRPYLADPTDPASAWHVKVPPHVAVHLMHRGGFTVVATSYVVHSAGTSFMRNDAGTGCGWGGIAFQPDEDGVVEVPIEAIGDLLSHGFYTVPAPVAGPAPARRRGGRPGEPAPVPPVPPPPAPPAVQGTDGGGQRFEKDADKTPHPDAPAAKE
jgi:hypothetical protein